MPATLKAENPVAYPRRGPQGALPAPDELLRDAQKIQTYKTVVPVEHCPTSRITDRVVEFLFTASEPFFAWCGISDPHHPFNPPGKYWHRFRPQDMPPVIELEGELDDKPPHFRDFYEGRYRGMDTDGFLPGHSPYLRPERIRLIQAAYYGMVALIDDSVARIMTALEDRGLRQRTLVLFLTDHGELLGDRGFVLKGPMH